MGEADVRVAAGVVVTALREAGRSEGTIRRYQAVLDRFAAFLAGRGLRTASDQACVDFIAGQTGTRLGTLREPVADRDVNAVRRQAVLMADALAGRAVVIGRPVIAAKDGCPVRFRPLRDDYVASCRARGNAEATLVAKDKAASRFLGYLDETSTRPGCPRACGTCRVSCCASAGCAARPSRGSGRPWPTSWTSSPPRDGRRRASPGCRRTGTCATSPSRTCGPLEEIRRLLAVINRQSAVGKRDYACCPAFRMPMTRALRCRWSETSSPRRACPAGRSGWRGAAGCRRGAGVSR